MNKSGMIPYFGKHRGTLHFPGTLTTLHNKINS
jgi:hypothetical protein